MPSTAERQEDLGIRWVSVITIRHTLRARSASQRCKDSRRFRGFQRRDTVFADVVTRTVKGHSTTRPTFHIGRCPLTHTEGVQHVTVRIPQFLIEFRITIGFAGLRMYD